MEDKNKFTVNDYRDSIKLEPLRRPLTNIFKTIAYRLEINPRMSSGTQL